MGGWVYGKVTIGLALHRKCVADSVLYPPTDLAALEMEIGALA